MARKKYKLTGFTRFFVVMLFLAPIAYIGASYYNGQDGIENIKNLLGLDKDTPQEEVITFDESEQTDVVAIKKRISELEQELESLKAKLEALEQPSK